MANSELLKEEVLTKCNPRSSGDIIRELCELLEDPIAVRCNERNLIHFEQYLNAACVEGVYLKDLDPLLRTMNVLFENLQESDLVRNNFLRLLEYLSRPFVVTKTSDESGYRTELSNFVTFMGILITNRFDEQIQLYSLSAMMLLLDNGIILTDAFKCKNSVIYKKAVEESFLPEMLTSWLEIISHQKFPFMVPLATQIINQSPKTCEKMVSMGILNLMISKLYPRNQSDHLTRQNLPETLEDVVSELDVPLFAEILAFLSSALVGIRSLPLERRHILVSPTGMELWILRYILRRSMLKVNMEAERNKITFIIVSILASFDMKQIVRSGLPEDLAIIISVATFGKSDQKWASLLELKASNKNLNFFKMILLALCYCIKSSALTVVLEKYNIPETLFKILEPTTKMAVCWSIAQKIDLLIPVARTISIIIPKFNKTYLKEYAIPSLMSLLKIYMQNDDQCDVGFSLISTFNSILVENENLLDHLSKSSLSNSLNKLFQPLFRQCTLTSSNQRIFCVFFNVMELLHCQVANLNSDLQTVSFVFECFQRILKPLPKDSIINYKLIACLGGYLWTVIVCDPKLANVFIEKGGIFLVLDVIQRSIYSIQIIFLGILVDLCSNASSVPYLLSWRGNKDKSITCIPLLLSIFRLEGKRREVQTDTYSCIKDIDLPIMGTQQWYETFHLKRNSKSSPATTDLLASCRPKIYAIITLMRTRYSQIVEVADQHYSLGNQKLQLLDQVTLKIAENYLALKLCQAWDEVSQEIILDNIKPISIDKELLETLKKRHNSWAEHLLATQNNLIQNWNQGNQKQLQSAYDNLRENCLQTSLSALRELEAIARTTDKMFRHQINKNIKSNVADLELMDVDPKKQHVTYDRNLLIQAAYGLDVKLESTPDYERQEKQSFFKDARSKLDNKNVINFLLEGKVKSKEEMGEKMVEEEQIFQYEIGQDSIL